MSSNEIPKISRRGFLSKLASYVLAGTVSGITSGAVASKIALGIEERLDIREEVNIAQYKKVVDQQKDTELIKHSLNLLSANRFRKIHLIKLNVILKKLETLKSQNPQLIHLIRRIKDFTQNYNSS